MSPRIDGSLPDGWVWVYLPDVDPPKTRKVNFLAYLLLRKLYSDVREYRKPHLAGKRGPKRRER